jgi:hypothetical protein
MLWTTATHITPPIRDIKMSWHFGGWHFILHSLCYLRCSTQMFLVSSSFNCSCGLRSRTWESLSECEERRFDGVIWFRFYLCHEVSQKILRRVIPDSRSQRQDILVMCIFKSNSLSTAIDCSSPGAVLEKWRLDTSIICFLQGLDNGMNVSLGLSHLPDRALSLGSVFYSKDSYLQINNDLFFINFFHYYNLQRQEVYFW